jgi:hypothetical protein
LKEFRFDIRLVAGGTGVWPTPHRRFFTPAQGRSCAVLAGARASLDALWRGSVYRD